MKLKDFVDVLDKDTLVEIEVLCEGNSAIDSCGGLTVYAGEFRNQRGYGMHEIKEVFVCNNHLLVILKEYE